MQQNPHESAQFRGQKETLAVKNAATSYILQLAIGVSVNSRRVKKLSHLGTRH